MSRVIRSVKNVTKGYSNIQVKVREATSNDPWGPTGAQMSEIAQRTFNGSTEFYEIVDMLDKRLNDKGKLWRHVLKALKVLDYCLHEGSEQVVSWACQNIYIIKTLREFVYVDENGRDVGNNVRVAAKELTSLLLDEERLRAERSDRKLWKSRVGGLDDVVPPTDDTAAPPRRRNQPRSNPDELEDTEYRLAIEASLNQEEEDRRRRAGQPVDVDDEELERALKLSREEDAARRQRELDEANATSLFDDTPAPQPQPTGFNQGYQQGSAVDFFANPIDTTNQGYMNNMYTGYGQPQMTGFQNGYQQGFGMQTQATGFDAFGNQQQQQQPLMQQQTSFNPYAQSFQPPEPAVQPGSNNPWASNKSSHLTVNKPLQATSTGSNNPFASGSAMGRPQMSKMHTLSSLPESAPVTSFGMAQGSTSPFAKSLQPQQQQQPPQPPSINLQQPQQTGREMTDHEAKLNALLASGDGMDTFGNTGNLRIPAQHTAPGTFVNSAGANVDRLTSHATGHNPFMRQQFTGIPQMSYSQMPGAGVVAGGGAGAGGSANPFAPREQQQGVKGGSGNTGDLIQL